MNERLDELKIDHDRKPEGGRKLLPWIALGLVIVVAAGLFWTLRPDRPVVRTATAEEVQGDGSRAVLNASGYVTARRQATVSSKFTAKITEVLVEEGLEVQEGELLARLDDSIPRAALELARAEARAAGTALQETRARLEEARIDLRRARSLFEAEVDTRARLDRAETAVQALDARLAKQEDRAEAARRQVTLRRRELDDFEIRAPFAGIVVSKDAQPGEMISPVSAGGGFTRTGICTLVDMDSLEIEVDVNEAYIDRVTPGQEVEAVLDAYPDWKIPARVLAIVPAADRQKATVPVRIAFETTDARILPDMGVKVAFIEGENEDDGKGTVLQIPRSALRSRDGRDVVMVVRDGVLERRAIRVGAAEGESVRLLSGLTGGEEVVVEGPGTLEDGDRVEVAE
ncbi:MAG: efflux RND transporter periplasmic adaptor subunit [Thermoanaerobaculia bacterium]|nr:efflux RND transporter periplasmic adaptor subunit [Thermoanaerobaculia bacterium]